MTTRAVVVVLGLMTLAACATTPEVDPTEAASPPEVGRDLEAHAAAVEEGRYAAAIAGLRPVVRAHPDLTAAKVLLGEAYLGQGDVAPAMQLFAEAKREAVGPSQRLAALIGTGLGALHQGDVDEAERAFRAALDMDQRSAEAWNGLAQSLDRQGRREEAERAAARAVRLAPDWQAAHNNHGLILLHQGRFAEAERAFSDAYALDERSEVVANNLRLSIAMQGRYEEALDGIRPAAEPDAFNNVGYAAIVRGDLAAADRYLRRAVETSPTYHEQARDNLRFLATLRQREAGNS